MISRFFILLAILLATLSPTVSAQVFVSHLVASNVFQIRTPAGTGSAFTVNVDGREYLLTAKHMVKGIRADGSDQSIEILKLKKDGLMWIFEWATYVVRIFVCDPPVDIAVLAPKELIRPGYPLLEPTQELSYVGQEGLFLGFPLGYAAMSAGANTPFPIAFAKRISLSAVFLEEKLFVFDAENNPGFSGGPIIYRDLRQPSPDNPHYSVNAVVSGFIPDKVHTAKWRPLRPNEPTADVENWRLRPPDAPTEILEDTETVVPTNTGITLGYSIKYAVELIKGHPVGPVVTSPTVPQQK